MQSFSLKYTKLFARYAALWVLLLTAAAAFADDSKISPDLHPLLANPSNSVNVIVQYNNSQEACGGGGLTGLVCAVTKVPSSVVQNLLGLINAASARLLARDVITLSNQSNVSYISLDRPLSATLDYTADAINAPIAWSEGLDGTGIGIAIIDSGIYSHPDLAKANSSQTRVVYRQSFVSGGVQFDDYGHGTHVAGIAAGNGSVSEAPGSFRRLRGIASNANILDLRVLDRNGMSTDSAVIAAIQEAVSLKGQFNVRVINLSLGRPIYERCSLDPVCRAAEAAWQNGIVVVTAAGNLGRNGYATILCPGNSPHSITVGAMKTMETYPRSDDRIASYSSRGPSYIDQTVK